ncbi:Hypothetical predicted protein [Mytilus galloprovincialis]|uniref:CCHC-type domain-containing protein n=1 Tax=Mytilus galloprovincialis TaxID=29158 RepID=A0A8B6BYT6_MYTGA|nr:Hypothetical predicted protein [Mytilus galloprovincialis]
MAQKYKITKTIGQGYLQSNNHKQNTEGKLPRALREKKDPEKIIIIDNIEQPNTAIDSTTIRKELTKIKALEDQIEEAYSLPKGGIAIHLKDQKTRDKIIKSWPINTSVFGEKSVAHKPRSINHGTNSCYLHNIPVHLSEENLSLDLSHLYKIKEVKRKKYRDTGKLMPVVKITFTDHEEVKKAITSKGYCHPGTTTYSKFQAEQPVKVVRCYNCNKFGHIGKRCLNIATCSNCGKENCKIKDCKNTPCCVNCGNIHQATSTKCEKYLEIINKRRLYSILNTQNETPLPECTGHYYDVDIVCLNETHQEENKKLTFLDWQVFDKPRKGRKGGGVAICINTHKTNFTVTKCTDFEDTNYESVAATIHTDNNIIFNLLVPYIPPEETKQLEELTTKVQKVQQNNKHELIIMGDLNAKSLEWNNDKTNKAGEIIENFLTKTDMLCVNDCQPTRRIPKVSLT